LSELVWNKPVLTIFREREPAETDPLVVVKAKRITVTCTEGDKIAGSIQDFFRLMGDIDCLISAEGATDHYVLCWFDDTIPDAHGDLRRLQGVNFTKVTREISENSKRTYNASFTAKSGKLE
jgi:hypothetical protein